MAPALSSYHSRASLLRALKCRGYHRLAERRRSHSLPSRLNARGKESVNTSTAEPIAMDVAEPGPQEPPSAPPLKADLPWKTLTCLTIGLALLIIMAEISRLSGSILDTVGQAWSFNELAGFGSFSSPPDSGPTGRTCRGCRARSPHGCRGAPAYQAAAVAMRVSRAIAHHSSRASW